MIALAIALLLMQQPQPWYGGDISGTGGYHWVSPMCSTYWNDEPVALPPAAQCTPDQLCTGTANPAIQPPEPFDVPALTEKVMKADGTQAMFCHSSCTSGSNICLGNNICEPVVRWTCAEKSRVLLTSEDGVRHCIKF